MEEKNQNTNYLISIALVLAVLDLVLLAFVFSNVLNLQKDIAEIQGKQVIVKKAEKKVEEKKTEEITKAESGEIDTSDWKTYRNEEFGFEVRYPGEWDVNILNRNKISIGYNGWHQGVPEGGRVIWIEAKNTELDDFITEYEASDPPLSQIINQEKYIIDKVDGVKLTASTALGVDSSIIFVKRNNKAYMINFHDFDPYHLKIVSTFNFLNQAIDKE